MAGAERTVWVDHAAGCDECHAVGIVMGFLPEPVDGGARVGRYILGDVVGRGAMGVVHAARDPELDREVAVKLHATSAPERLRREARALARLSHPNVVQVHDVGEHEGRAFVAMELVDGESLRDWLRTARPAHAIVSVLAQAGRGLSAAHAAGLIHRDFKPDNVLLARDGRVLVTDFGLACAIGAEGAAPQGAEGAKPGDAAVSLSSTLTATGAVV